MVMRIPEGLAVVSHHVDQQSSSLTLLRGSAAEG